MMPITLTPLQAISVRASIKLHRDSLVDDCRKKRGDDAAVIRGAIEVLDSVVRLLDGSLASGSPFCRPKLTENADSPGEGNGRPRGDPANDS